MTFNATLTTAGRTAVITLAGNLDAEAEPGARSLGCRGPFAPPTRGHHPQFDTLFPSPLNGRGISWSSRQPSRYP
jgi:hypothetical protein